MRTNLVDFFARFRAAGIGDAKKRARYSDDIQLVREVSEGSAGIPFDYDNLIPTTIGQVYEVLSTESGPNRPTIELVAGGRGIWLMAALHSTFAAANIAWWSIPAVRAPALARSFTPTQANSGNWGDGSDSLSTFNVGTAVEDVPAEVPVRIALIATNAGQGQFVYERALYVAPGQVVTSQRIGSNSAFAMGFRWRDIPPA